MTSPHALQDCPATCLLLAASLVVAIAHASDSHESNAPRQGLLDMTASVETDATPSPVAADERSSLSCSGGSFTHQRQDGPSPAPNLSRGGVGCQPVEKLSSNPALAARSGGRAHIQRAEQAAALRWASTPFSFSSAGGGAQLRPRF